MRNVKSGVRICQRKAEMSPFAVRAFLFFEKKNLLRNCGVVVERRASVGSRWATRGGMPDRRPLGRAHCPRAAHTPRRAFFWEAFLGTPIIGRFLGHPSLSGHPPTTSTRTPTGVGTPTATRTPIPRLARTTASCSSRPFGPWRRWLSLHRCPCIVVGTPTATMSIGNAAYLGHPSLRQGHPSLSMAVPAAYPLSMGVPAAYPRTGARTGVRAAQHGAALAHL